MLKKFLCLIVVLAFVASQSAFADELLNLSPQKNLGQVDSQKLSSSINNSPQDSKKSSSDLIGFGPDKTWRIKPGFEFKTVYDSNINREPPGQRNDDIILNYTPSVEVERKGSRFELGAGYAMNFQEFLKDNTQNSFNHTAHVQSKFTGNRLKAKFNDNFSLVRAFATSEQTKRRTVLINDVNPEVAYRLTKKFSIASIYRNYLFNYRDSDFKESSYDTNEIGGRVYYHVRPKLDLYLEGDGNIVDYYRSGTLDSKGFSILAGSVGRVTKKLQMNLSTGFQGRYYDNSSINSFNGYVVKGILLYKVAPKLTATFTAQRNIQEAVYRNTAYYIENILGIGFDYRVTHRINFETHSSIGTNRYPSETTEVGLTKKRRDYLLDFGAGFKWKLVRNLFLGVGYNLRQRTSNFDNVFDYLENAVEGSISYKFS